MTKKITLKIIPTSQKSSSCLIEGSVDSEDFENISFSIFSLSSLQDSLKKFKEWQRNIRKYIPVRRGKLREQARVGVVEGIYPLESEEESYRQCERSKNDLFNTFNRFLSQNSLEKWLKTILDSTSENVRVVIQTDSIDIAALPWEQWSFWDSYYEKNDLVIALSFLEYSSPKLSCKIRDVLAQTKILVLLGEEEHDENDTKLGINLGVDREEFQKFENDLKKLGDRADIDIHICHPNREELEQILQETWHIVYYGGHSQTLESEQDGILCLKDNTQVKISELENIFKVVLKRQELRLLVANACQGLGTAFQLVSFGLPHAIVMRESIPDDFAHDFLRYLLESFIIGLTPTSAIQHCKPHLREAYDLRHQLPGASLLPALCLTSDSIDELDRPIIPLTGLHPICKEMRALANLAKARLTLDKEEKNSLSKLKVQEYYAKLLHHKNKFALVDKTTEVKLDQLSCSQPQVSGKLIWEISFLANVQGQILVWGQGYVNIKTGDSELLLDVRPLSWTGVPVVLEKEIKQLSLPENAKILVNDELQKLSFTKYALVTLEKKYKEYVYYQNQEYRKNPDINVKFSGVSEIKNFGGRLKDINKKKFLKELVNLQNLGYSYDKAKGEAYKKTPFGKARNQLGIFDFQLTSPKEIFVPLIQVIEEDEWTVKDRQNLKEKEIPETLWGKFNVPQYIIVSQAKRPNKTNIQFLN